MDTEILDDYLPASMRAELETRYYARVNEQARIEHTRHDPQLWTTEGHVTWYSDHGVVHVRDVACLTLHVLDVTHGMLIPPRPLRRFAGFMKTYGVLLAYLHDIGMSDFSPFGRAMHPQYAAHAVFGGALDGWISQAWDANLGDIPGRLVDLQRRGVLAQQPEVVFRELLSLNMAHSKHSVPMAALNNPHNLRQLMLHALSTDLPTLYAELRGVGPSTPEAPGPARRAPYQDHAANAFSWLTLDHPEARELVDDVVDSLRVLRCADALRQRGTVQKTSAGYEVFVSLETGSATFAVREGEDKLYLVEHFNPISTGEANIASSELTRDGHLYMSFHRGAFANQAALELALGALAVTVNDMQADIIPSFERADAVFGAPWAGHVAGRMQILLEAVDDNPLFVDQLIAALVKLNPALAGRLKRVPSLAGATVAESARYVSAARLDWDPATQQAFLARVAESGQRVEVMDVAAALEHVRVATVAAHERLIEAGTPSGFVYVPLDEGLVVVPLGGYQSFPVKPYMPLGITGVIRGSTRNADVIAERAVDVLIIPKEVYMREWYRPYTIADLHQALMGHSGA